MLDPQKVHSIEMIIVVIAFVIAYVVKLIAIADAAVPDNTSTFPGIFSNIALHTAISSSFTKIRQLLGRNVFE